MRHVPKSILAGVGLIALSALLLEVNLTRIFSVTLWYYFGFLAISLALLGTAAAGVFCYALPDRLAGEDYASYLTAFALLFGSATPLAISFHLHADLSGYSVSDVGFYSVLGFELLILFAAFFCAGMCITIALFRYGAQIGTVYFSDLVGASLGSLLVVPLLYHFSAPAITFAVSMGACAAAWLFARGLKTSQLRTLSAVMAALFLVLFLSNDRLGLLKVVSVKSYSIASAQMREDNKVYEKWSPISRVAVFAPSRGNPDAQLYQSMQVTNDAGAPTLLHEFDGDFSKLDYVSRDSRQLVHHLKPGADILIIGSGGGMDVLAALLFAQKRITAVEINPVIIELVSRVYAGFIGHIFEDPRVTLHLAEGRNFVAGSPNLYDAIQITMIDSWTAAASGAYMFNENSLYTIEAIEDYVGHLKPDGILSITRYYDYDEALRLTNMLIQYLVQKGVNDVDNRLIVAVEPRRRYRRATVLLKNGVFTPDETSITLATAKQGPFSVVYAPHVGDPDLEASDYAQLFRLLINPQAHGLSDRTELITAYPKNLAPPTDNRPFFFFMRYFRDSFRSDPRDHAARRLALPLLYGMFLSFGFLGLLTIFLPLYLSQNVAIRKAPYRLRSLTYFVGLGVGYILIEISLIQRLTIFLGHPTYSFVLVLTSLLFSSGLGSFASGVWARTPAPRKLLVVLAGILVIVLFYVLFVYDSFTHLMWLEKPLRILTAVLIIFPPGFLMGMCFPMGMQIVRQFHEHLVPWGWGVNGAFSVFASILSLVLALNFGFKAMMSVGLAFYALAFVIIFSLRQTGKGSGVTAPG